MQLRSSDIKSTVGKLSSAQVSKIGKQIGATGDISRQRRMIYEHVENHHGTALKAEKFLKDVGLHHDKKEFTSVLSGFKGIDPSVHNEKLDFKTEVGAHTQESMIAKAVEDSMFRKSQKEKYGDSFDKMVKERIEHKKDVAAMSIGERKRQDAEAMLKAYDTERKLKFGVMADSAHGAGSMNEPQATGGPSSNQLTNSQNKTTPSDNYKQPPPTNNQFFAA
jgi:hypothetical protein